MANEPYNTIEKKYYGPSNSSITAKITLKEEKAEIELYERLTPLKNELEKINFAQSYFGSAQLIVGKNENRIREMKPFQYIIPSDLSELLEHTIDKKNYNESVVVDTIDRYLLSKHYKTENMNRKTLTSKLKNYISTK